MPASVTRPPLRLSLDLPGCACKVGDLRAQAYHQIQGLYLQTARLVCAMPTKCLLSLRESDSPHLPFRF